jgi:hypothetical protein
MMNEVFVLALMVSFGILLRWAFKNLPKEKWQILAAIPVRKDEAGVWTGVNLTYYGIFTAIAVFTAVSVMFVLLAAIRVPAKAVFVMVGLLLVFCLPSAKFIARLVEKKTQTLTIGGASFVGFLLAPGVVWILGSGHILPDVTMPVLPALASLAVAYAVGEGLGRLACISFGCCYGKPLAKCSPWIRRVFGGYTFVFSGELKKIAYERALAGQCVAPIQAVTSVLYLSTAAVGILLYLNGRYAAALIITTIVTQIWRVLSEFLRADHRGGGRLSAYQIMAIGAAIYSFAIPSMFGAETLPAPDLETGLVSLWDPGVILFLQFTCLACFLFTGRSMVTASTVSFHVVKERI